VARAGRHPHLKRIEGLRSDDFADNTRSRFIAVYRELERGEDPYAIDE
jgi:hypothetical protein